RGAHRSRVSPPRSPSRVRRLASAIPPSPDTARRRKRRRSRSASAGGEGEASLSGRSKLARKEDRSVMRRASRQVEKLAQIQEGTRERAKPVLANELEGALGLRVARRASQGDPERPG